LGERIFNRYRTEDNGSYQKMCWTV